ncbi:glycosyltransferase family 39 protein [Cytophagales bacterium LB-30]|uniref:Glycosyltransferase family 39 protein n=1 Tax=Shiella aurantiaca TaxID=3058365 RepID=A0ABT8F4V9_9BACT|nr:glycosyltransferase family 39 protein [Shiella aurantiaca]MDN4165482.1 glycosyltransferase family 39 protein [Shiella aurantiaca]
MAPNTTKPKQSPSSSFIDSVENWITQRELLVVFLCMVATALLCIWQFNPRMSFATDDAGYVRRAFLLIDQGNFPTYQGPLYPLFLSVFVYLFGISISLLKGISTLLLVAQVFFFYKAFRSHMPPIVWLSVLVIMSLNPYFLYYGSYTFNEAFMLCIQALVFWLISRHWERYTNEPVQKNVGIWLLFGFLLLLLQLTKSVSVVAVLAFAVYFLIHKKWAQAGASLVSLGFWMMVYQGFLRFIIGITPSSQLEQLTRKNFYDPSQGQEDMAGYIARFTENFGNYISVHFYKILGFRPHSFGIIGETMPDKPEASIVLSILFIALAIVALWKTYQHNKLALVVLLYAAAVFVVSFFALQTIWNQDRLIIPYVPYVLLGFFAALYYWSKESKNSLASSVLAFGLLLLPLVQFPLSVKVAKSNSQIREQVNKGYVAYGFMPSIVSFVEVSKWIGENIPRPDTKVVTNKPEEAFMYAGGNYFERINAKNKTADELLALLKEGGFTYLMVDRLGANAGLAYQTLQAAYPEKLSLVVQAGTDNGATYLFKINY